MRQNHDVPLNHNVVSLDPKKTIVVLPTISNDRIHPLFLAVLQTQDAPSFMLSI